MSDFYKKFRDEIVAGGDTVDQPAGQSNQRTALVSGLVLAALIVWLGVANPWTLVFVVGLIVSVFLHEVGHFVTARKSGMKVTQFYMGFGPRLWSAKRGELEYGLRAFPLGAFVRIIGMNNLDECAPEDEKRAYKSQSFPKRLLVITAGSIMHMVIAFVLFVGVYSTAGRYAQTGEVEIAFPPSAGSPAAQAGIVEGDIVLTFDGQSTTTREQLVAAITSRKPGDEITLEVQRDGQVLEIGATLGANPVDEQVAYFGVGSWSMDYVQQNVFSSIAYGASDVVVNAVNSVKGVFTVLNPINVVSNVTSSNADPMTRPSTVVGASQIGGEIGKQEGLKGVLMLLASVNIFVGVFNMFPLLPFDGGHAAIAIYERIRSRRGVVYRADVAKMVPVATSVVVILALLLLAGLYLDITQPLG
jgi:membrane-associated protease RseP (regulator of RpoE activity)